MRPTGEWLIKPGGLAERLARLREAAGLTGLQMAGTLGWDRTKISKIEHGRQMPTEADITAWAQACGQPGATADLLDLLSEAQTVHRQYRHHVRRGQDAIQVDFDRIVREAGRIRNFEVTVIPGLLQTADYARYRALEAVRVHGFAADRVEEVVAARTRRQDVLYDSGREFEFIITEAALRFRLCPPQVMLGQIDRLDRLAGLANITLAIIPFDTELDTAPMHGFLIADDFVSFETHVGEESVPGGALKGYGAIADRLLAEAVTGDDARQVLSGAAARLRQ